jgi:hypothetical protein
MAFLTLRSGSMVRESCHAHHISLSSADNEHKAPPSGMVLRPILMLACCYMNPILELCTLVETVRRDPSEDRGSGKPCCGASGIT